MLIHGVGVGVDEDDRERLRAFGEQRPRRFPHLPGIDVHAHGPVRQDPLVDLDAHVAIGDRRKIAPETPGARPIAAAHLQDVAKAAGRDHADPRALTLQQRVGAHRRAMHDRAEIRDRT